MEGRIIRSVSLLSLVVALLAAISSPLFRPWLQTMRDALTAQNGVEVSSSESKSQPRTPVYFFSHGGPDVQYNTSHPAYPILQNIGREITQRVRPTAVVVFSAHWMGEENAIHINNAVETELIYDFSGFPDHFYEAKYPSVGSPDLASKIMIMLSEANIQSYGLKRGLDHGVWSGFHVAFNPRTNPLNVPLVQVSLFKSESPNAHYALGKAVSSLRDQGVVIIGAGMSVHNLRDMVGMMKGDFRPMPYAVSFDNALREAVETAPPVRQEKMAAVCRRPDARQAHPFMDHLMPLFVAAGAAEHDHGQQTWTMQEGSFAWAQYRFGHVPS